MNWPNESKEYRIARETERLYPHRILVEEKVVDRPSRATVMLRGNGRFASDQQPASGLIARKLIAGQEARIFRQQRLQHILAVVGRFLHLD